ncbi:hypothetical protein HH682_02645 [Rosenbergiella sp. S61]|uniref:Uncharacterized protein n=1 Tax=Rosenbergiella gaditana TaxID=2726987 RepID=A0ABS5STL3_9GAMM|nr:hypothetical protein [Rosenbergiella gaditana]MBT0723361.1 hypothetical protein [Rosenbergiella gaditana]
MDIGNVKGTGIYIIVERLYDFMSNTWHNIGMSNTQVHRIIYQLYKKEDIYLDGKRLNGSSISLWQRVKVLLGHPLVTNPSLDNSTIFSQDYAGSIIFFIPFCFPGIKEKILPRFLTHKYRLPTAKYDS